MRALHTFLIFLSVICISTHAQAQGKKSSVLRACLDKNSGSISIRKKCKKSEGTLNAGLISSLSPSVQGQTGLQGAQGQQGSQGPQGAQGPKGDTGSPGISGLVVETKSFDTLNMSLYSQLGLSVNCKDGKEIISGGCDGGSLLSIVSSYPFTKSSTLGQLYGASGFTCYFINFYSNNVFRTATAYAVCGNVNE